MARSRGDELMNGVLGMAAAGVGVGAATGADNFRAAAGLALVDGASARSWVRALILADAVGLVIGVAIGSALPLLVADVAPTIGLACLAVIAAIAILGADEFVERAVGSRSCRSRSRSFSASTTSWRAAPSARSAIPCWSRRLWRSRRRRSCASRAISRGRPGSLADWPAHLRGWAAPCWRSRWRSPP